MKHIILAGTFLIMLVVDANSQDPRHINDFSEGQLVAMTEIDQGFYLDRSSVIEDAEGLKSGKLLSFHENGAIAEIGHVMKNEKFGVWKKYDENGNLIAEARYQKGLKDGIWKVWDVNGVLRLQFQYESGKRVGNWLMYDENGNLTSTRTY